MHLLSTIHCSLQDEHYNLLHCYLAALHSRNRSTLAGTSKHACMRIYTGESFTPGEVTHDHTLGRNDRGVTPTGESFIPLTPVLLSMYKMYNNVRPAIIASCMPRKAIYLC